MQRAERIRRERQALSERASERWKGFQSARTAAVSLQVYEEMVSKPQAALTSPFQNAHYEEREAKRRIFNSTAFREVRRFTERQIGATLDFADLPPDEQALKAGRPVVRLVTLGAPGIVPEGFASGFLIAPDLILTNHHVFRARDEAVGIGAQFLYEKVNGGLRQGLIFALEPERFFVNHKGLDYAIVAVKTIALDGAPLSQFQYLPLIATAGKIRKGDPVNIIQYPEGGPKKYATVNNHLLDFRDDGFLLYETDTLEGSSGSPVFSEHWETIGLHHCGVPLMENGKLVTRDGRRLDPDDEVADSDLYWIGNEGIRVSALVASLSDQRLDSPEQQEILRRLLVSTKDPLNIVTDKSPIIPGTIHDKPDTASTSPTITTEGAQLPMAQNVFNFTGPVTIHVHTPATSLVAVAPASNGHAPQQSWHRPQPTLPGKRGSSSTRTTRIAPATTKTSLRDGLSRCPSGTRPIH